MNHAIDVVSLNGNMNACKEKKIIYEIFLKS
jgi:hypothetical protein